jgi:hypothetical protein
MNIEIDNGNFFYGMGRPSMKGCDCDIVYETESHSPAPLRVMARRTYGAKR